MKFITRFIDVFLFTSILTACCATGLCMATEQVVTNMAHSLFSQLHILVFGSTLLVYNTPRIVKKPYGKTLSVNPLQPWFYMCFLSGLCMTLYGLYGQAIKLQLFCLLLGIFAFAYFLPLLPFKTKKRIRDFGWLKISVLTIVWTTATAVLPIIYWGRAVAGFPFEVLLRMFFIFALCVLFDLRDVQQDVENNIYTLPSKVGIANSYRLIYAALSLFVIVSVVQYSRFHLADRLAAALITAIATIAVAIYLRKRPSDKAYAILADGVMLVYALAILI